MNNLNVAEVLAEMSEGRTLIDVRSPGEFEHGHIMGAVNLPLFSNEERAEVGTIYKQKGPEPAMLRGLEIVGPKMADLVRKAEAFSKNKKIAVHCWRGGQRSRSVAWLLATTGFDVKILRGGYKNFRGEAARFFAETDIKLIVLGGKTGSGKTKILKKLAEKGAQVIDLEAFAHHKGSAFGSLGEAEQPTVEMFENRLFLALRTLDPGRPVWIENESHSIGKIFIPNDFWKKMKAAPIFVMEIPDSERVKNLCADYADQPIDGLKKAFSNIEKKLGGQHFKAAVEALDRGEMSLAAEIALVYYDKTYQFGLDKSGDNVLEKRFFDTFDRDEISEACLDFEKSGKLRF